MSRIEIVLFSGAGVAEEALLSLVAKVCIVENLSRNEVVLFRGAAVDSNFEGCVFVCAPFEQGQRHCATVVGAVVAVVVVDLLQGQPVATVVEVVVTELEEFVTLCFEKGHSDP